ncbi:hypothetical protein S40285_05075 [Stachybotrys chlorohalonatus IBT 40285]|uniref:Uncharacterized protein n=1 Tax=Stachybotrys chlorohalonatus (strain IBT 40285) TaxID=1283841 RepID=A0A084Q9N1_STAC4|nr:hypothetical protein S40285_05075 [Stachybotrys chlorohalonata IBT 40285]
MSISLYDASIPFAKDALSSLKGILTKASSAPNASGLLDARIYDDMNPLSFQIYTVVDICQKLAHRLQGKEPLKLQDDAKTLEDWQEHIKKAEDILAAVDKSLVDSRANEIVPLAMGSRGTAEITAWGYAQGYAFPNIYFHLNMTYAILRKEGVPVGKLDYLGPFLGKHLPKEFTQRA